MIMNLISTTSLQNQVPNQTPQFLESQNQKDQPQNIDNEEDRKYDERIQDPQHQQEAIDNQDIELLEMGDIDERNQQSMRNERRIENQSQVHMDHLKFKNEFTPFGDNLIINQDMDQGRSSSNKYLKMELKLYIKTLVKFIFNFYHVIDSNSIKDSLMQQQIDVFLFVNPKSGSKHGQKFLDLDYKDIVIEIDPTTEVVFHITNLTIKDKKDKALKDMFQIQQQRKNVYKIKTLSQNQQFKSNLASTNMSSGNHRRLVLAIAGGDGTMMFIAQDALQVGLSLDEISICVLPFGTGNDLSQIFGWGSQPKEIWTKKLKSLAIDILEAIDETFNVWDITVKLRSNGDIRQWDSKEKSKVSQNINPYERPMSNYFSIGVESRIGLGFEKSRTNSAFKNKCVYGWEGLKKMCCCSKTLKIKDVITHVTKVDENNQEQLMFHTGFDKTIDKNIPVLSKFSKCNDNFLEGNPVSLVCTNISSMMGGKANVWQSGHGKATGLADNQGRSLTQEQLKLNDAQSHDDDILEFETIASTIHLGLGKGQRIAQEKGIFNIHFREPAEGKYLTTYIQIDGEFYRLENPEKIQIKLSDSLGHLKLLRYKESDK
ncbi:diacylglycerol [Stylonychia lemnae]|uniref:Diacylglycerol kinase n=1 Tax=Stylonychia lemnae TaxID=5949 RepID=A0A077ZSX7_STYLE|nr:diacylglycerol [Stylonychia lemnae]|eukprot:CDW72988.1 diacylglycerol [Stylonychia lemnae]